MTSRFNILAITLLFATTFTLACGGEENQASTSPIPVETVAGSPEPSATATSTAPPATATPAPSPTTTPEPEQSSDVPIAEWGNAEIYVMNADGSDHRRLTNLPSMEHSPAWSPDGSMLAFVSYADAAGTGLYVMNADGTDARLIFERVSSPPVWLPDGSRIVVSAGVADAQYEQIVVVAVDGSGATRLTSHENVPTASLSMGNVQPAVSPDGTRIAFTSYQSDGPSEIHVMDADGSNVQRLTDSPTSKQFPVWSPDGTRIAYTTDFPDPDVWVMNADGSDPHNVSNDPAIDLGAEWSPDGEQIAFVRQADSGSQIVIVSADGSDARTIVEGLGLVERLGWSPDGSTIVYGSSFAADEVRNNGLLVVNADGSDPHQLTDTAYGDAEPQWSPDGTMIAFVSLRDGGQPVACSWSAVADFAEIGSAESVIWTSHLIVAGTIVEDLGPAFGGGQSSEQRSNAAIYTDYILEAERQFRGHPLETVRLRVEGGKIGGCVQTFEPSPTLTEGMRALLFLGPEVPDNVLPPAHFASVVGFWTISADDTLITPGWAYNPDGIAGLSLDEAAELVSETLAGEPPPDAYNPVPLEESPATPQ